MCSMIGTRTCEWPFEVCRLCSGIQLTSAGSQPKPSNCSMGPPTDLSRHEPQGHYAFWSQNRKVQLCYEHVLATERAQGWRYEFVARLRPDGKFTNPLPFTQASLPKDAGTLFSYTKWDDARGRDVAPSCVSDHFAYVPRSLSDIYFNAANQLSTCYPEHEASIMNGANAECILGYWLKNHRFVMETWDYEHLQLFYDDGNVRLALKFDETGGYNDVPAIPPPTASRMRQARRR